MGQGGSTAVTAILINGSKLWVANVGDSRAVLLKGGEAIQMSIDHDPNAERGAIENKGGFVSNMPGGSSILIFLIEIIVTGLHPVVHLIFDSLILFWNIRILQTQNISSNVLY